MGMFDALRRTFRKFTESASKTTPAPPPSPPKKTTTFERVEPSEARGKTIRIERLSDLLFDLEVSLLEADVAFPVVERIRRDLESKLATVRVESDEEVPRRVEEILRETLRSILSSSSADFDALIDSKIREKKPVVLMFVGVNGTGKTTAIARIAYRLKKEGRTCVLAAGDTFRAGAIEQLSKHAEALGITVVRHSSGSDPAAVAFDAVEHARSRLKDVVLLDTAGRMQTNTNLMDEMKKIRRVARPDLVIFVGDALSGNDTLEQAQSFDRAVGIDGVILTKVDADARGGAALSLAYSIGKPIFFLGIGQDYSDLIPFDPSWMVERIFD